MKKIIQACAFIGAFVLAVSTPALALAQYGSDSDAATAVMMMLIMIPFLIAWLIVCALTIVAFWKLFAKAGQAGWKAIVPFYNMYVLVQIIRKPWWWFLLLFVPYVNIVVWFLVSLELAKSFGKGTGFAVGIFFLGFIFLPIIAFGRATYQPVAEGSDAPSVPTPEPVASAQETVADTTPENPSSN